MSQKRTFDDAWKRWLAENLLLGVGEKDLLDTLIAQGWDRAEIEDELQKTRTHPFFKAAEKIAQQREKALDILEMYRSLKKQGDLFPDIPRLERISSDRFYHEFYYRNQPLVLTGMAKGWRAFDRWSPTFFRQVLGDLEVEVQACHASDPVYQILMEESRTRMTMAAYIDCITHGHSEEKRYYMVSSNRFLDRDDTCHLFGDLGSFPGIIDPQKNRSGSNFWLGPKGTVTHLHHDVLNIFFIQVYGRKSFKLISPDETHLLYNHHGVFSDVDPDQPDLERYPLFAEACVHDVLLSPGDILFLPVGWWHHVRSLDPCISISFTNFTQGNGFSFSGS